MTDVYYSPEKFGLTTIGEIDWSSGSCEFDLTVVWKRDADGTFWYGEDSGCSCPSPFDNQGMDDLTAVATLEEFKAQLEADNGEQGKAYGDRSVEIAELLERMHAAGAR